MSSEKSKCVVDDAVQLVQIAINSECKDKTQRTYSLLARQSCIDFIRRCCFAYLNKRMERLKALRWKYAGNIPQSIKVHLSAAEIQWLKSYEYNLAKFQEEFGDENNLLNLMTNIKPAKSLYVQVHAVEDYGEFELSDGTVVVLKKNSLHSLPREDCEMLLRQGVLEFTNK
uniref:DNA replication complex GINS protein PSF1 n=1 Tax=Syphacia muris TaxID=451379 RepID=A0A0N5AE74_9BILA